LGAKPHLDSNVHAEGTGRERSSLDAEAGIGEVRDDCASQS